MLCDVFLLFVCGNKAGPSPGIFIFEFIWIAIVVIRCPTSIEVFFCVEGPNHRPQQSASETRSSLNKKRRAPCQVASLPKVQLVQSEFSLVQLDAHHVMTPVARQDAPRGLIGLCSSLCPSSSFLGLAFPRQNINYTCCFFGFLLTRQSSPVRPSFLDAQTLWFVQSPIAGLLEQPVTILQSRSNTEFAHGHAKFV